MDRNFAPERRRLSDRILIAFDEACKQLDAEAAERLLLMLEWMDRRDSRMPDNRRTSTAQLDAARHRLQVLLSPFGQA
jgi:hypothetical protein